MEQGGKIDTALPEVRNNGTAIQWKYSDEADWHDLVALTELRGAAGEAGKDGANGKDGINAKSIEVQRAATHIQWRYAGDEWQNLVAIVDITGPAGQSGKGGANGKTPEIRVNENTLQWRYTGDEIWLNLYDLSVLKGLDGKDGTDGATGKDGKTPFIGENGNWWIGETDTGVKAAGVDGEKGDKGDPGEKVTKAIRVIKATRATPVRTAEAPGILRHGVCTVNPSIRRCSPPVLSGNA